MPILQSLIGNAGNKVGAPPAPGPGAPSSGVPNLPPGGQAGNTPFSMMDHLSGLLGGGDPLKEQNNAYVQGRVNEYMAQQQQVKARAQQKGAQAAARELKKGQSETPPPQLASPGTGTTPSSDLSGLWQRVQASLGMK